MAKVTYTPDPAQAMPDETMQYGHHFKKGQAVDVTDEAHLAKFRGNPYFSVAGKEGEGDYKLKDHQEMAPLIQQDEMRKAQGLPPLPPEPEPAKPAAKKG